MNQETKFKNLKQNFKRLLLPALLIFGKIGPSFASSKNIPEKKSTVIQRLITKTKEEHIKQNIEQPDWVKLHNKNVLRERAIQEAKQKQTRFQQTKLLQKERLNFIKNKKTLQDSKFFDKLLPVVVQTTPNQRIFNRLAKNDKAFTEYTNYINQQVKNSNFRNTSKLTNLTEIFGNRSFVSSFVTKENMGQWQEAESFFTFIKVSSLPLSLTISNRLLRKLVGIKGGFNPFDALGKAITTFFSNDDSEEKKRNEKEPDKVRKNFLQMFFALMNQFPVAVGLSLNVVHLIRKDTEKPPLPEDPLFEKKKKNIRDRIEDILKYFIHHPAQLFVLIFILYNHKTIWGILTCELRRELFVFETSQKISKLRNAVNRLLQDFIESYTGDSKVDDPILAKVEEKVNLAIKTKRFYSPTLGWFELSPEGKRIFDLE